MEDESIQERNLEIVQNDNEEKYVEDETSCDNYKHRILEKIRNENEKIKKHIARRNEFTAELKKYEKERKLKLEKGRYLGFVLNDLRNEKKKTEELVVSELLRSELPTDDRKRENTVEKLKRSRERVQELQLEYQNQAFPEGGVAEEGEEAQLREDY